MEAKTLGGGGGGGLVHMATLELCSDHFARKERRQGGQLFVVGSVIVRYPSKVQKQTIFVYEHS